MMAGALACLSSCIMEDDFSFSDNKSDGVNLIISVAGMGSKALTKEASERTDRSRIEDMNIVLADASGKITEIIYVPSQTQADGSIDMEENGLLQGNLPTDNGNLVYHVGSASWSGASQIYVVCNYWQVDRNNEIIPEKRDLNKCLQVGTSTIDDLKQLKQGTPLRAGIMTSTLFGQALPDSGTEPHGGQTYSCSLQRTTAMVTVAICSGNGDERLNEGVRITPRSICLHNVPVECYIGQDNAIGVGIEHSDEGLLQQVSWGQLMCDNHGVELGGHGADENITPLFLFENKQGIMNSNNADEVEKAPDKGKEDDCSYIEVIADYLYVPSSSGGNQKYISGPIAYRLYLGENITNDFNVNRNKHYQVTLSLKGMGGLVEDGRTDKDGNYIGEGEDASWRVESSGVSGGGSFLTDGVNMASNGFLSYVGFVGEENHKYAIYCEEGAVGGATWLWAETSAGRITPTENFPATVYEADECGGEEGVSYVMLYAQPWIDEWGAWEQGAVGDISTISNWIENGYREAHLILKDLSTGIEVNRLTLRQWLPMPVMVDDDGNEITTGDPNDAAFYYSRIDVYEGREISWGPDYFNTWDAGDGNLQPRSVTYYESYYGRTRNYDAAYGFDNVIAVYAVNRSAFTFTSDYGRPGNAVGTAVFRAGNAVTSSGNQIEYNPTELARIGLPTLTEWEKIMQYGVVDVRFGISNVPYWTSSMQGTQSYIYYL